MAKKKGKKDKPQLQLAEEVTDELRQVYADAKVAGIFLVEGAKTSFCYITAAGSRKKAEELERQMKKLPEFANQPDWELDLSGITMERAANLGTWVGTGQTRVQACHNAIKAYKKHHRIK